MKGSDQGRNRGYEASRTFGSRTRQPPRRLRATNKRDDIIDQTKDAFTRDLVPLQAPVISSWENGLLQDWLVRLSASSGQQCGDCLQLGSFRTAGKPERMRLAAAHFSESKYLRGCNKAATALRPGETRESLALRVKAREASTRARRVAFCCRVPRWASTSQQDLDI